MKIPVERTALSDPRFVLLGVRAGISTGEALFRCLVIWDECYRRRDNVLPRFLVAGWHGEEFCDWLCEARLALAVGPLLRIAGVLDRLRYFDSQAKKASAGGKAGGRGRPKADSPVAIGDHTGGAQ
jgi:hypothetical protein